MPPASLSTFAVMKPGPTTAKKSARRIFQCFNEKRTVRPSAALPQHRDHVIGRDDAGEPAVLVYDGEGDQVVFVEELGDFIFWRVWSAGDVRVAEIGELSGRRRDRDLDKRHGSRQLVIRPGQVDRRERLAAAFEGLQRLD